MTLILHLCLAFIILGSTFAQAQNKEIPLRSGDQIGIKVSGIPPDEVAQISQTYRVSENGTISLLYLNEVSVAGVKPSELERKIAALYKSKEIYTHPNVSVSIDSGATDGRVVYVSGAVTKPGPVPMRPGLTVSKAIAFAGGKTAFGRLSKVKLVRGGQVVGTLNLERAGSPDGDTLLDPEDEVVVPD
jgi:polysaccharide export outer membrane protein